MKKKGFNMHMCSRQVQEKYAHLQQVHLGKKLQEKFIKVLCFCFQGVKPASFDKVMDPEIKEIIGECICKNKEERFVSSDKLFCI